MWSVARESSGPLKSRLIPPIFTLGTDCMSTSEWVVQSQPSLAITHPSNGAFGFDDMHQATCIQSSLLPAGPLADETFEIAFRYSPYLQVGGDFADFFRLPNGLIAIYVGDVVGKGLPAALYGALVMGALRGIKKTGASTAAVLGLLNERLMQRPLPGRFCSALYALFDPVTSQLALSNAGMPFPLLASRSTCQTLGEGGLPSGVFPHASYDQHTIRLSPGDSVLFASDGLHETRNREGIEFAAAQMAETWAGCRGKSARESLDLLFEGLHAFSHGGSCDDDVTVVVLNIPPAS